jgi:hypothetical protein
VGQDHVGLKTHQFCCTGLHPFDIAGASVIDSDVAVFVPAQLLESLLECIQSSYSLWIVFGEADKHSDPPHGIAPLRVRG